MGDGSVRPAPTPLILSLSKDEHVQRLSAWC